MAPPPGPSSSSVRHPRSPGSAGGQVRSVENGQIITGTSCTTDADGSADPSAATEVVCLVSDGAHVITDTLGTLERVSATTHQVVVLAADDGRVVARWPADAGDAIAWLPGGVVVLASATPTSTDLTAYDQLTGEERWSRSDPRAAGTTDLDAPNVALFRAGDVLLYRPDLDGSMMLLSSAGDVVRDVSGQSLTGSSTDGRLALQGQVDGHAATTFLSRTAERSDDVTLVGEEVRVDLDDDSVPGLVLTEDGGTLRAWDERTGEARWVSDELFTQLALVFRGRVVVPTSSGIVALDGRTGAQLWSVTLDRGLAPGSMFTDGRHLLVAMNASEPGTHPFLAAYDPASGHLDFRAPYPDGVDQVNRRSTSSWASTSSRRSTSSSSRHPPGADCRHHRAASTVDR